MATITECDPSLPPWSTQVLLDGIAAVDRHLVVFAACPPVDLPSCWFGDPRQKCGEPTAVLQSINRLGRKVERSACRACLVSALCVTCDDGGEVTVLVPMSGTRRPLPVPAGAQLVGVG